jgi:hypothetical protein
MRAVASRMSTQKRTSRLWLLTLIISVLVDAQWRGTECKLSKRPIVLLSRNDQNHHDGSGNNFTILETISADADPSSLTKGNFRFLEEEEKSINNNQSQLYYARVCDCFAPGHPTVYCPLTVSVCQRPSHQSGRTDPGCLTVSKGREQAKSIYMIPVVWFGLLLAFTLLTKFGWSAVDFMISLCIPKWNRYVANRMLQRDPDRALSLIRNNLRRRRRWLERRADHLAAQSEAEAARVVIERENNPLENEPSSLLLQTRIYRVQVPKGRPSSVKSYGSYRSKDNRISENEILMEDDSDDLNCTICFSAILGGERVGVLACEHSFHVECLKSWLPRRNTCPLCQAANIAIPQYDKDQETALTESVPSTSNISHMTSRESSDRSREQR